MKFGGSFFTNLLSAGKCKNPVSKSAYSPKELISACARMTWLRWSIVLTVLRGCVVKIVGHYQCTKVRVAGGDK